MDKNLLNSYVYIMSSITKPGEQGYKILNDLIIKITGENIISIYPEPSKENLIIKIKNYKFIIDTFFILEANNLHEALFKNY